MSLTRAAGSNPHIVGIRPVALSHFLPPEASECVLPFPSFPSSSSPLSDA